MLSGGKRTHAHHAELNSHVRGTPGGTSGQNIELALNSTPSVTKSRGCCHSTSWPRRGLKCVTTTATGGRRALGLVTPPLEPVCSEVGGMDCAWGGPADVRAPKFGVPNLIAVHPQRAF